MKRGRDSKNIAHVPIKWPSDDKHISQRSGGHQAFAHNAVNPREPAPRESGERVASTDGASRVRGSLSRQTQSPLPCNFARITVRTPSSFVSEGRVRAASRAATTLRHPGLDPRVHLLRKNFLRTGWIAGSSPAMMTAIAARVCPSPGSRPHFFAYKTHFLLDYNSK